jgi:hypothetical protein
MKICTIVVLLGVSAFAGAQQAKTSSPLRSVLLQELRETHNEKNWFVSEKEAAGGLTAEQAAWNDGKNHSVGQLVEHLTYWNSANLANLKHQPARKVANNDATFDFDPKQWETAQKEFDQVMTELEQFVQSSDDATLVKIAPTIARVAQHNAYHIGEMVTSRKKQGTWNPENGVK